MTATSRAQVLTGFAVSGAFWGAFGVWLPALQRAAGVGDGQLGLALGALALAALPLMPAVGRLADRRGAVEVVQLALVASALTLPLTAWVGSFPALVAALLVLGVTTGALDVALNAAAAEWEGADPAGRRPLMSLAHAVFSFGVVAGSLAAGGMRELGLPVLSMTLLLAAGTAAAATVVPVQGRPPERPTAATSAGPVRSPLLLVLGVLVAASFVVEDGLQSWTPVYLEQSVDARPAVSALGLTVFAGAMGAGRLAGHALVLRWGDARLLAGGGVVGACGLVLLVTAPSALPALAGLALAGAGTSVLAPVLFAAVGRRAAPGRRGQDLALVNGLGYVGFVLGPPLVGVVSALSTMSVSFALLGLVGLLVAVLGPRVLAVPTRAPAAGSGDVHRRGDREAVER